MIIELVGLLAVFLGGLAVGYVSAQWRSADVVERFRDVDGKFYERWKAFQKIEGRNRQKDGTLLESWERYAQRGDD